MISFLISWMGFIMPAQAGIHHKLKRMDASLRWHDRWFAIAMSATVLSVAACEQNVHIKSSVRVAKIVIDDRVIESVGPDGRDALVPINFGPASYSAFENDRLVTSGLLPRSQIQPWLFGLCVGGKG
ncbi:MAG: hypothetical protein WCO91_06250 [Gemmataceae bacterium]